jgi:hypothetical protein
MSYLRQFGFKFYPYKVIKENNPEVNLLDAHEGYSFMVRPIRKDELDTRLIFGIKLNGRKSNDVLVYYKGSWLETVSIKWKDEADINFRKTVKKWIFPDYMSYLERRKWRAENNRVIKNPNFKPSEFYLKCKPDVRFIGGAEKNG